MFVHSSMGKPAKCFRPTSKQSQLTQSFRNRKRSLFYWPLSWNVSNHLQNWIMSYIFKCLEVLHLEVTIEALVLFSLEVADLLWFLPWSNVMVTVFKVMFRVSTTCFPNHLIGSDPQMRPMWRRDVPLERVGNDSPVGIAPAPSASAVASGGPNMSWVPEAPQIVTPDNPMFLMTSAAQTISGFFVWTALLLTCHQVSVHTHTHTLLRAHTHVHTLFCICLVEFLKPRVQGMFVF